MARTKNVDTTANDKAKSSLSAQVSFPFGMAVRQVATNRNTTVSGLIEELVYDRLGLELPDDEKESTKSAGDKITLSASIDSGVYNSLKAFAESEDETVSALLKQWLATTANYDLSAEPKADRSEAMKRAAENRKANAAAAQAKQSATVNTLLNIIAQMNPDMAAQAKAAIEAI